MKKIFKYIIVGMILLIPMLLLSDTPEALSPRTVVINFQGSLVDADGLAYSGEVDIEAWFYNSSDRLPSDLIYAEEFLGISVEHGMFRLPLLSGSPLEGTVLSIESLSNERELYVDIKVDDITFLEAWPVGSQLAAIRAERAVQADALRIPITLSPGDIPLHSASLITTGHIGSSRLPSIPGSKITSGVFSSTRIAGVNAASITGGTFGSEAFNDDISAVLFTTGTLNEILIPDETVKSDEFAALAGTVGHGEAVGIPGGFSRTQCAWMVSVNELQGSTGGGIDYIKVLTDHNGVVTCEWDNDTPQVPLRYRCVANYLTVCKK